MNVTVTITGTSPNYTITPSPAGPYIGSVAVTFQNIQLPESRCTTMWLERQLFKIKP
jgi:hypothetical protein